MYRLQKENVIKVVDSAVKRDSLLHLGFSLLSEQPLSAEPPAGTAAEGAEHLESMTVQELKEIARKRGLDASVLAAKRKQEIIAILKAAEGQEQDDAADIMQEGAATGHDND